MYVPDRQISPDEQPSTCARCSVLVDEEEIYCDCCTTYLAEQELDLKSSWWDNFNFDLYYKLLNFR